MAFCGEIRTNIGHAIPFNGIIYLNLKRLRRSGRRSYLRRRLAVDSQSPLRRSFVRLQFELKMTFSEKTILVSEGAGFIGSHTVVQLLSEGFRVSIIDNLDNFVTEVVDRFDALIHFAGLKAVGESVANPRRYFDNNLIGTINLYEVMAKYDCKKMVFSSSATVCGQLEKMSCVEDFELKAMNPYGRTKRVESLSCVGAEFERVGGLNDAED
ncbi:hypothetical protein SO802_006810 [Lithocarpus litseifolius]|uniref:NAD-dependent epimerase/dehydratase domain-containing protein n=1 Tax=Lithocarpus litseifolius TaxID=425828 RepID=A0AAW2DPI5_9ROSI